MFRVLALAAAALAAGAPPTTAGNRAAARRDVHRLLRLVVLPAGAHRLASPPGHAHGLLGGPFQVPGGKLVDHARLWRVDEPFASVVDFVRTHPPRGTQKGGPGSGSVGGPHYPQNETVLFTFPQRPGRISFRWLNVTLVALPDGSTGVRADAQDIWVVTRPLRERVPDGVREIDVDAHRVTSPARVAKIARWFDALPIVQPDAAFSCPALVYGPVVRLAFRTAAGALLAGARMPLRLMTGSLLSTPCSSIRFRIGGHEEPALVGGRFLLRVERLLGVRLR